MTRTPAGSHSGPHGRVPDEPALDPEVVQLAGQVFDLARQGATDTLAAYVDAGVPADLTDDEGRTLLLLAAEHGRAPAAAALLERGAHPDRADPVGRTPLTAAVLAGADAVVDVLLDAGADPSAGTPPAREAALGSGRADLVTRFDAR